MFPPNNIYRNPIKICRISRTIFQWSLLWPDDSAELHPETKYKIKVLSYFLITGVITLLMTISGILAITNGQYFNPDDLGVMIAAYGVHYMVGVYIKKQHEIALILQEMSNFERFGEPPNFKEYNKRLNFLAKMLTTYLFIFITVYMVNKYLEKSECKKLHAKLGSQGNYCGLAVPIWLPFQIDQFPVFQLLIIYAFVFGYLHPKMCIYISFQVLELSLNTVARINHLKTLILKCFDDTDYEISNEKLTKHILYHKEVLNLAAKVDNTFTAIMFGHFALTGIVCACLEKQIIDGSNILSGITHFMAWIAALFVVCLGGQRLKDTSGEVADAIWTSKWYEADTRLKKNLLLMIMRSQKNCCMTAGPLGILCFPFFVLIMKTSYSILCVLTT